MFSRYIFSRLYPPCLLYTSLPCAIGAEGVEEVYTLDLSEHELEGFHKSCQHIRDNIAQLDWWDAEAYDAK